MAALAKPYCYTIEDFYAMLDVSTVKLEYHDGEIVAMSGGSRNHCEITDGLISEVGFRLRGTACRTYSSETMVRSEACNMMYFPDLTVVCGEPKFYSEVKATLLNPVAVFEVLSPSTQNYDKGEKADCYRAIPSLQTYVLIAQETYRVETHTRQADDTWQHDVIVGQDATLTLDAIGCSLPLRDLYARATFANTVANADRRSDNPTEERFDA